MTQQIESKAAAQSTQLPASSGLQLMDLPLFVILLLALFTVLALGPWLDNIANDYIDEALLNSGMIYATARGINALISVLQTVEVSVFFVSLDIGEILDPVNDLIERFSDVLSIALASLALQKILLVISSNILFKLLLTGCAVILLIAQFFQQAVIRNLSFKVLISLIFIRLAFAFIILANTAVDHFFLQQQTEQNYQQMKLYQTQLDSVADLVKDENHLNQAEKEHLENQLIAVTSRTAKIQQRLNSIKTQIAAKEREIKLKREHLGLSRFYSNDAELKQLYRELKPLTTQQKNLEQTAESLAEDRESIHEQLDCIQKRTQGESCGFSDWLNSSNEALNLKQKVLELSNNIGDFVDSTLQLLTLLLLKTLLLPLLFWWLLYRIFATIWRFELPFINSSLKTH